MVVQRGTPVPPSRQIAAFLRQKITSGELAPDSKLPSHMSLAHEYGVAPETAAKAVKILREEGLVQVVPGYGTFVTGPAG
jgi:DNA-binding GntR family transcriptional regulator